MENEKTKDNKSSKKRKKYFWPIAIVLILVFLVFMFLSSGMLAYKYGVSNPYLQKVVSWIPYPAAIVNYEIVGLSKYYEEVKAVEDMVKNQEKELTPEVKKSIRGDVIEKLIHDEIISQLAEEYDVEVTEEEIEQEKEKMIEQLGVSREEADKKLQELYGWDFDTFFEKIVISSFYQQKVREAFFESEKIQNETKDRAQEVLEMVKAGEKTFEEIAREYSDDERFGQLGGEVGWVAKGNMPPELETAAFSMEKGDVSDLIKTEPGYHIIKIEDKKEDDSEVFIRDIFISYPDFEQHLLDYLNESKVYKFVK
jgi:foldase protein PrsA